jgi:hypothetical protein
VSLGLRDATTGKVIVDDGERDIENAYISACVAAGNVEALYYALLRKRARLATKTTYAHSLRAFEGKWGTWVNNIQAHGGV